jgi:hypothetical protein
MPSMFEEQKAGLVVNENKRKPTEYMLAICNY